MKIFRRRRLILAIIIFALLIWATVHIYRSFFVASPKTEDGVLLKLPSLPLTPANMTKTQKTAAIEQARQDAQAAALASGQSEKEAEAAGLAAEKAAQKAFYRAPAVSNKP